MEEGRTAVKRNWREGCKVCISAAAFYYQHRRRDEDFFNAIVGVVGTTHGGERGMHNIKDFENPQYLI